MDAFFVSEIIYFNGSVHSKWFLKCTSIVTMLGKKLYDAKVQYMHATIQIRLKGTLCTNKWTERIFILKTKFHKFAARKTYHYSIPQPQHNAS